MPTPESAKAFARLVASRERLTEITKHLNECHSRLWSEGLARRQRYAELQTEWDVAFHEFEVATDAFSAIVKQLPEHVVLHSVPMAHNNSH